MGRGFWGVREGIQAFGFSVSGFRFQVSGFRSQFSVLRFQASGVLRPLLAGKISWPLLSGESPKTLVRSSLLARERLPGHVGHDVGYTV